MAAPKTPSAPPANLMPASRSDCCSALTRSAAFAEDCEADRAADALGCLGCAEGQRRGVGAGHHTGLFASRRLLKLLEGGLGHVAERTIGAAAEGEAGVHEGSLEFLNELPGRTHPQPDVAGARVSGGGCRRGGGRRRSDRQVELRHDDFVDHAGGRDPIRLLVRSQCSGRHRSEDAVGATSHSDTGSDQGSLEHLDVVTAGADPHPDEWSPASFRGGRVRDSRRGRGAACEFETRCGGRIDGSGHRQAVPALEVRDGRLRRRPEPSVGAAGDEHAEPHQGRLQFFDGIAPRSDGERAGRRDRCPLRCHQPERRRRRFVDLT